ncbi:MAG: 3-oxoacyl-[acyl-carrier protein] reductase [Acidobacteriota bacterium]|jgi:3-oxoacyl-[acyl-carrier protein] reductase
MDDLGNRVALVTGGSRGIGRAIATALAGAGARVAVNFREKRADGDAVVRGIEAIGGTAVSLQADVSDHRAALDLVRETEARLGPIGIVVNNAGVNRGKPLDQLDPEIWNDTIQINLSSAFYVTQAALPGMRARRWGRIIMVSSVAAQTGGVIGPHYAASKAGLLGLTHSYANLLAGEGITSNAIAPALIDTDMIRGNPAITPSLIPIGRFGTVEEVAAVAVMLASNGYITGQTINVNGGWAMS